MKARSSIMSYVDDLLREAKIYERQKLGEIYYANKLPELIKKVDLLMLDFEDNSKILFEDEQKILARQKLAHLKDKWNTKTLDKQASDLSKSQRRKTMKRSKSNIIEKRVQLTRRSSLSDYNIAVPMLRKYRSDNKAFVFRSSNSSNTMPTPIQTNQS